MIVFLYRLFSFYIIFQAPLGKFNNEFSKVAAQVLIFLQPSCSTIKAGTSNERIQDFLSIGMVL
mgnify:CR=1 FL=1